MRMVPWKHTPDALGPIANAHGVITLESHMHLRADSPPLRDDTVEHGRRGLGVLRALMTAVNERLTARVCDPINEPAAEQWRRCRTQFARESSRQKCRRQSWCCPSWRETVVNHFMKVTSTGAAAEELTVVTWFFGAVVSEQAVMTTEAMMAVAMRSLRRIIGWLLTEGRGPGWVPAEFATSRYGG